MKTNLKRVVDTIRKSNVYTPIVESIANAIEAVDESGKKDGEITITIIRTTQKSLGLGDEEDNIAAIESIEIRDNGVGFNDTNFDSFDTLYSEHKASRGGKGFGRFTFLKYFEEVLVKSTFEEKGTFSDRTFGFSRDGGLTEPITEQSAEAERGGSTVLLKSFRKEHAGKLDKKLETVARKLVEKLLLYFVLDEYVCPKITIKEEGLGDVIVLNEYISKSGLIRQEANKSFELINSDQKTKEGFKIKVFKLYYADGISSVNLVADNRLVTEEPLYSYIPEFKDNFVDSIETEKGKLQNRNYIVKAYVMGKYLNDNVTNERHDFEFQKDAGMFYPFSKNDIEKKAAGITQEIFGPEVTTRQQRKKAIVSEYVNAQAPWLRNFLKDADLTDLPQNPGPEAIVSTLQRAKFRKETQVQVKAEAVIKTMDKPLPVEVEKEVREIIKEITELGQSDLVHYVALRKAVLNFFKESLTWDDTRAFEKEEVVHNVLFPMKTTSDDISYEQHNLWMIDERLSFHEYLTSDLPIAKGGDRPDILIFNHRVSMREGDTPSNPIVVFELKRPQRTEYAENDNPLGQIADYVRQIRAGKLQTSTGRPIHVTESTPAYGYLVCDLTPKIKGFCADFGLTESPDKLGFFGFHPNHKIYYEVTSFDKLVKDAEQRNKIFFNKLGIDGDTKKINTDDSRIYS